MPRPPEMLALHLLKPEEGSAFPFTRAMPHIHVTHPCAPDSPNGLDNPIFIVEDEIQRIVPSENENNGKCYCEIREESQNGSFFIHGFSVSSGTSPTPVSDTGFGNYLTLVTHSLPVSPIPRAWDQLSCVSTPSRSISEASSS